MLTVLLWVIWSIVISVLLGSSPNLRFHTAVNIFAIENVSKVDCFGALSEVTGFYLSQKSHLSISRR